MCIWGNIHSPLLSAGLPIWCAWAISSIVNVRYLYEYSRRKKPVSPIVCQICGKPGHVERLCPNVYALGFWYILVLTSLTKRGRLEADPWPIEPGAVHLAKINFSIKISPGQLRGFYFANGYSRKMTKEVPKNNWWLSWIKVCWQNTECGSQWTRALRILSP